MTSARPRRASTIRRRVFGRGETDAARLGRWRARSRARGRSCSRSRRSSRRPISPCRAGSATGVDPKRLSMIVAVLGRHVGHRARPGRRLRQRRRRRANRRARRRPRHRARDRLRGQRHARYGRASRASARSVSPVVCARSQAERRLAECTKLGPRRGPRTGRDAVSWQNSPHDGGDATAGDRAGARCERTRGRIRPPLGAQARRAGHGAARRDRRHHPRAARRADRHRRAIDLAFLFSGGMRLDLPFTSQLLYELAKMDGAIIVNSDLTRLVYANVQLMPDPNDPFVRDGHAASHGRARRRSRPTRSWSRSPSSARR